MFKLSLFCFLNFFASYEKSDVALNCGMMLREAIAQESLARVLLYSPQFYKFFEYVELSTFEIASDAFSSFKVSLRITLILMRC